MMRVGAIIVKIVTAKTIRVAMIAVKTRTAGVIPPVKNIVEMIRAGMIIMETGGTVGIGINIVKTIREAMIAVKISTAGVNPPAKSIVGMIRAGMITIEINTIKTVTVKMIPGVMIAVKINTAETAPSVKSRVKIRIAKTIRVRMIAAEINTVKIITVKTIPAVMIAARINTAVKINTAEMMSSVKSRVEVRIAKTIRVGEITAGINTVKISAVKAILAVSPIHPSALASSSNGFSPISTALRATRSALPTVFLPVGMLSTATGVLSLRLFTACCAIGYTWITL